MGGPAIKYISQLLNMSNCNPTCEMEDESLFDPYAVARKQRD